MHVPEILEMLLRIISIHTEILWWSRNSGPVHSILYHVPEILEILFWVRIVAYATVPLSFMFSCYNGSNTLLAIEFNIEPLFFWTFTQYDI